MTADAKLLADVQETLLDVTNALSDSITNTHPYAAIVKQARGVIRELDEAREALVRRWNDAEAAAAHFVRDDPMITPLRAMERQAVEIERLKNELAAKLVLPDSLTHDRERIEACLRACDGLATIDLAGNKRGWLAEVVYDAHKLDDPVRAGAEKCLKIVKEMRATMVHDDGVDYGILSRVEYRLQRVVDAPIANQPSAPQPQSAESTTEREFR